YVSGHSILKIQPNKLLRFLLNFLQHPLIGPVVVVSPVADDQNGGLAGDRGKIVFVKFLKSTAEIRMRKNINHVALERGLHRVINLVLFEKFDDFTQIANENETANFNIENLHRIDEL